MVTMNKVLVTGANGFVGSAICEKLLSLDRDIRIVGLVKDINYKTKFDLLKRISVIYGDVRDYDCVRYAVSRYEIDTIFHLAAITILRQSEKDPRTCYSVNVFGTLNVLEAARECGVKKVVSISSDKAYGHQDIMPYVESLSLCAEDPYSTSKSAMDLISRSHAYTYGMDVSVMRSGNIYGPGDLNLSRIVPNNAIRCLSKKRPTVYRGVEKFKREFMYIDDVVNAYILVAEKGLPGEAYNVGGSGAKSPIDVINEIRKAAKFDEDIEIVDKDFIEIKEQWLDASKLKALGWSCNYTIETGIPKAVEWYREYLSKKNDSSFIQG